jgi:hypothetical protein
LSGPESQRPADGDESSPEVQAVLDGVDQIKLDEDLVVDSEAPTAAREEGLFSRLRKLSVAARVKLALRGNKDVRQILARDAVKLVQLCVLKNPRFTLEEALAMAKNRSLNGELLRIIAEQRDWVRQYAVRLALVQNPKTPLPISLGLLSGIQERDVRILAKSKNVASVLQAQAKRMLQRRSPGGGG